MKWVRTTSDLECLFLEGPNSSILARRMIGSLPFAFPMPDVRNFWRVLHGAAAGRLFRRNFGGTVPRHT
jgi:hypothetical protein